MKKLLLFSALLFSILLFDACSKDKDVDLPINPPVTEQEDVDEPAISRSDTGWVSPTNQQLNVVWNDMMSNIEYIDALNFIYLNGVFNWNEARLVKELDENNYLISIPSMMGDKVISVLFASVIGNSVTYFHVHLFFMQQPTEEIINTIGVEKAMLAITTFVAHEQHFGNYTSVSLIEHLNSDLIRNAMFSATPRGWCLIEVELYNPPELIDSESNNCNCNYYNLLTGNVIMNPPEDFNPEEDDPTWIDWHLSQETSWEINYGGANVIIHGNDIGDGVTVFQFWAWCPDEQDQDGWTTNWTDNDSPSGGGSNPNSENPPDWTYYGMDLFEGGYEECMFYYGGMAATQFNAFRQQLLASSCGDAAAYVIQNAVVNTVHGLCDDAGDGFPTYDIEETKSQIENSLAGNTFYEMGKLICENCQGNAQCISQFDQCGTGNYEECIAEIIGKMIDELLLDNNNLLLEIDCDQIESWQTLAQHVAPQSVSNKIDNLPNNFFNDFYIQSIDDANGTMVNLDYFGVNISSFPDNPSTGQAFTADEFLDYIRRNFNEFVDGSTFEPYCENVSPSICQQETDLWNSTNPLGSIIYIDIPGDDGVVICTEFANSYWYFMTMNAPFAGNHPVSGTRQFGYETNPNGSYNFFIRGADRFESNTVENLAYILTAGNPFFGADDLWESFQINVMTFVNTNGGSSANITPIKNRPDWDKIDEILKGIRPISDLGCD